MYAFRIINGQHFLKDGNHIYHIIQIEKKMNAFLNIYHGSNIRQISDQTSHTFVHVNVPAILDTWYTGTLRCDSVPDM